MRTVNPILNYKESYNMHVVNSQRFAPAWTPSGLYSYAELVDLIGVQGYIPVATANELNNLRNTVSQTMGAGTPFEATYLTGLDKKYVQLNNIDLSIFPEWAAFNTFSGIFDGNQLTIENLTSNSTSNVSLIGSATNSTLKNININVNLQGTGGSKSSLAGTVANTTITSCHATGTINSTSTTQSGGLIVSAASGSVINNCTVAMSISINGRVGGFASVLNGATCFTCFSNCVINSDANTNTGGFCDEIYNSTVYDCYSTGSVSAINGTVSSYTGGFVGNVTQNSNIYKCYSNVDVYQEGLFYTGVFCGRVTLGSINNCYSSGSIETTGSYAAGFVGRNAGSISNCYHTGLVTVATTPRGGFCSNNAGTISNSYWDTVTSGQATSAGGTGKTTTEMQQGLIPDTTIYVGWDNTIWNAGTLTEYPTLIQ